MGRLMIEQFDTERHSIIVCSNCSTHICLENSIIRSDYECYSGMAHLVNKESVTNIKPQPQTEKRFQSGSYILRFINCLKCEQVVGWKYIKAYENENAFKVNNFLIEKIRTLIQKPTTEALMRHNLIKKSDEFIERERRQQQALFEEVNPVRRRLQMPLLPMRPPSPSPRSHLPSYAREQTLELYGVGSAYLPRRRRSQERRRRIRDQIRNSLEGNGFRGRQPRTESSLREEQHSSPTRPSPPLTSAARAASRQSSSAVGQSPQNLQPVPEVEEPSESANAQNRLMTSPVQARSNSNDLDFQRNSPNRRIIRSVLLQELIEHENRLAEELELEEEAGADTRRQRRELEDHPEITRRQQQRPQGDGRSRSSRRPEQQQMQSEDFERRLRFRATQRGRERSSGDRGQEAQEEQQRSSQNRAQSWLRSREVEGPLQQEPQPAPEQQQRPPQVQTNIDVDSGRVGMTIHILPLNGVQEESQQDNEDDRESFDSNMEVEALNHLQGLGFMPRGYFQLWLDSERRYRRLISVPEFQAEVRNIQQAHPNGLNVTESHLLFEDAEDARDREWDPDRFYQVQGLERDYFPDMQPYDRGAILLLPPRLLATWNPEEYEGFMSDRRIVRHRIPRDPLRFLDMFRLRRRLERRNPELQRMRQERQLSHPRAEIQRIFRTIQIRPSLEHAERREMVAQIWREEHKQDGEPRRQQAEQSRPSQGQPNLPGRRRVSWDVNLAGDIESGDSRQVQDMSRSNRRVLGERSFRRQDSRQQEQVRPRRREDLTRRELEQPPVLSESPFRIARPALNRAEQPGLQFSLQQQNRANRLDNQDHSRMNINNSDQWEQAFDYYLDSTSVQQQEEEIVEDESTERRRRLEEEVFRQFLPDPDLIQRELQMYQEHPDSDGEQRREAQRVEQRRNRIRNRLEGMQAQVASEAAIRDSSRNALGQEEEWQDLISVEYEDRSSSHQASLHVVLDPMSSSLSNANARSISRQIAQNDEANREANESEQSDEAREDLPEDSAEAQQRESSQQLRESSQARRSSSVFVQDPSDDEQDEEQEEEDFYEARNEDMLVLNSSDSEDEPRPLAEELRHSPHHLAEVRSAPPRSEHSSSEGLEEGFFNHNARFSQFEDEVDLPQMMLERYSSSSSNFSVPSMRFQGEGSQHEDAEGESQNEGINQNQDSSSSQSHHHNRSIEEAARANLEEQPQPSSNQSSAQAEARQSNNADSSREEQASSPANNSPPQTFLVQSRSTNRSTTGLQINSNPNEHESRPYSSELFDLAEESYLPPDQMSDNRDGLLEPERMINTRSRTQALVGPEAEALEREHRRIHYENIYARALDQRQRQQQLLRQARRDNIDDDDPQLNFDYVDHDNDAGQSEPSASSNELFNYRST